MKAMTEKLLKMVSGLFDMDKVAYNIREDGACAGRRSSEHIQILPKGDLPGLTIHIDSAAQGEVVYIPACVTHSGVDDLVYNDFFVDEGADVTIVAGCGVHSEGEQEARHNGIHRFYLGRNARVRYEEKHVGTGAGAGGRVINPVTEAELAEGATLEMDTTQICGVDQTTRTTKAAVAAGAKLLIRERLMTDGQEQAVSSYDVVMDGQGAKCDIISRSVAKGRSYQEFAAQITGKSPCQGHAACDAIIMDQAIVKAVPALTAQHVDAALVHEAAIGKIAGEQILKLCTLGLTEEQAEARIVEGFLK